MIEYGTQTESISARKIIKIFSMTIYRWSAIKDNKKYSGCAIVDNCIYDDFTARSGLLNTIERKISVKRE